MSTHIKLTTIHGESWVMHKDNIKAVNLVNTPDAFIEQWQKDKVVIITTTEMQTEDDQGKPLNPPKPWQFMVSQTLEELEFKLCGEGLIYDVTVNSKGEEIDNLKLVK